MLTDKEQIAKDLAELPVSPEEIRAHMQRVEELCRLIEGLFGALAHNPLFSAMIPPDLLAQLQNK